MTVEVLELQADKDAPSRCWQFHQARLGEAPSAIELCTCEGWWRIAAS
jgi:hypothetical protein